MLSPSSVYVHGKLPCGFLGNDIYHSSVGIRSVKRRCCTLYYFYVIYVIHSYAGKVHVVHRFACQSLAVNENENILSSEPGEVEMYLLVHGIAELHTRHYLLKQILEVGCVSFLYVLLRYYLREYGCLGKKFRRACTRYNHLFQVHIAPDGVCWNVVVAMCRHGR